MSGAVQIRLKRVYDPVQADDGLRLLVDRLWPRGLSKAQARIDHWCKAVAPSSELRRWFGHQPERWPEFRHRYETELAANPEGLAELRQLLEGKARVTLLFGARDEAHNQAVVLRDYLLRTTD